MYGFVYGQSEYNIMNSTLRIEDYIAAAVKEGYSFLTITDKNLSGFYKFYLACMKKNILPVIGLEVTSSMEYTYLVYAKNLNGYHNLVKLASAIQLSPDKIDLDFIIKYSKDCIIVLSGFSKVIVDEETRNFKQIENIFKKLKSSDFYFGVSFQMSYLKDLMAELYELASKSQINVLPMHRTYYLDEYDQEVFIALKEIDGKTVKIARQDLFCFPTKEMLKTLFVGYDNVFDNLDKFKNSFKPFLEEQKILLPTYPKLSGMTSKEYLQNLSLKGLRKRLLEGAYAPAKDYINRLKYELTVIDKMGYNDYFLIVWDFVCYAKKQKVMVGPGRGSAAGSLVAYSLGIISIDPLRYDLLFERFLNPERVSMPDIDMDFPDDKRDFIIEYVRDLYGKNHVCNISAFATFKIKLAIRDLCRINDITQVRTNEIVKMVVNTEDYSELQAEFIDDKKISRVLRLAKKLENIPHHVSTHAAGIILSNDKLTNIIPIQEGINGMYQSQLEAKDLEKLGLLKIDFLGIRNLSIIDNVCKEIPGLDNITISRIPLNDSKTYQMLSQGDTLGIFQLESAGITNVIKRLKPNKFNDLIALLALYRPGPMQNIDKFLDGRFNNNVTYFHNDLKPILEETNGIILYQEQIMKIALKFAGYSLGEADILRRGVSKKQADVLIKEREKFVKKSIETGYSSEVANDIYDYIVKFANYGFNKSHSAAYAMVAYQMAYLKANYFSIFMSKLLNNVIGSSDTMKKYISYSKMHGLKIMPPSINKSQNVFVSLKNTLYMPFSQIRSVGKAIEENIIEERKKGKYLSFLDFKKRVKVSDSVLEALIFAGCFSEFELTKKTMVDSVNVNSNIYEKYIDDPVFQYDIEDRKSTRLNSSH